MSFELNPLTGFGVGGVNLGTPTLFVRGSETIIHDFDTNTSDAPRMFNGDTTEAIGSGSGYIYKNSATDFYCGLTFSAPKKLYSIIGYGCTDQGWKYGSDPTITLAMYAKNGSAPSSYSDGTLLNTLSGFTDDTGAAHEIFSDSVALWDHVWIHCNSSVSGSLEMAELQIYTYE